MNHSRLMTEIVWSRLDGVLGFRVCGLFPQNFERSVDFCIFCACLGGGRFCLRGFSR